MNKAVLIIPTFNQKLIITKTIGLIINKQTYIPDIIVVDSGSADGTCDYLKKKYPFITLIEAKKNYGGSAAQFIGMRYAYEKGYEWLIMSDNDAFPKSNNLLEVLLEKSTKNKIYQPLNISKDQIGRNIPLLFHYGCIHRDIIKRFGFPLSNFFLLYDDIEYLERVREGGVEVDILKNIKYEHPEKRWCPPNRYYFRTRNKLILYLLHKDLLTYMKEVFKTVNTLFVLLWINELNYFKMGTKGLWDFLWKLYNNSVITDKIKINLFEVNITNFKLPNSTYAVNLEPGLCSLILPSDNNNYYGRKKINTVLKIIKKPIIIQGSLLNSESLILSFFCKNIICINDVTDKIVYTTYKSPGYIIIKVLYLLICNLLFFPFYFLTFIKKTFTRYYFKQNLNYKSLIKKIW